MSAILYVGKKISQITTNKRKKKEKEKKRGKSVIVLLNDEGTISILAAKCRSVPWLSSTPNKNKMKEHKF